MAINIGSSSYSFESGNKYFNITSTNNNLELEEKCDNNECNTKLSPIIKEDDYVYQTNTGLLDTNYFKDVSWTISYDPKVKNAALDASIPFIDLYKFNSKENILKLWFNVLYSKVNESRIEIIRKRSKVHIDNLKKIF